MESKIKTECDITKENVYSAKKYLDAARALNRYVKDNFSRREYSELAIAPIIADLHTQVENLDHSVNMLLKSNPSDYIHKGDCFKGQVERYSHENEYIRILTKVDRNKCKAERISIENSIDKKHHRTYCSYDECDMVALTLMQGIISGSVTRISNEEFEAMKMLTDVIFDMAIKNVEHYESES